MASTRGIPVLNIECHKHKLSSGHVELFLVAQFSCLGGGVVVNASVV